MEIVRSVNLDKLIFIVDDLEMCILGLALEHLIDSKYFAGDTNEEPEIIGDETKILAEELAIQFATIQKEELEREDTNGT